MAICAVSTVAESKQFQLKPRIVGGGLAKDGQFTYQVSLRQTESKRHHCGASIISGFVYFKFRIFSIFVNFFKKKIVDF